MGAARSSSKLRTSPAVGASPDRRRWLLLGAGGLGVALVGWALFGGESDEDRIRAQLARLESVVRVTERQSENPLLRAVHLQKEFETLLERDVQVSIPEVHGVRSGRDDLARVAAGLQRSLSLFEIRFSQVTVQVEGTVGRVAAITHVTASVRGEGSIRRDERHTELTFGRDAEGQWLLHSVLVASKAVIPD